MVFVIGNSPSAMAALKSKPLIDLVDECSLILNETANKHHWQGKGSLSLKVVLRGEAVYTVENRRITIDEHRLLVLNDHQNYRIAIDNKFETETFIVFFNRNLINAVTADNYYNSQTKLDNPFLHVDAPVHFTSDSKEITAEILSSVHLLKPWTNPIDHSQAEEELFCLFQKVVDLQSQQENRRNALNFEKYSTRRETAKRVLVARDFLHSNLSTPITLEVLSRNSALSKNHLLRTFKEYFGKTPFQYLNEIRIKKAKKLLLNTDTPVSEICAEIGLESLSSFSWAFRKQEGLSPTQFRENGK